MNGGELSDADLEQATGGVASVAPGAPSEAPATGVAAGVTPSGAPNATAELQQNMSDVSRLYQTISSILKAQHEIAANSIKNLRG